MRPAPGRYAVVALLVLGAGLLGVGVAQQERPVPPLPSVRSLASGDQWQVDTTYRSPALGPVARQWLLRTTSGQAVLLYVGVTSHLQSALRWRGELGYQGDGYVVVRTGEIPLHQDTGIIETVDTALVRRLGQQRYLASAVVGPDGPVALRPDALLRTTWGALAGRVGPYFMVRVSAIDNASLPASGVADRLLAEVLPRLQTLARGS